MNVFKNNDVTMTETSDSLENWKFKEIKLKDLIDLDFPLPQFNFSIGGIRLQLPFNYIGFQAISYD